MRLQPLKRRSKPRARRRKPILRTPEDRAIAWFKTLTVGFLNSRIRNNGVHNRSATALSATQTAWLGRNLKFVPTPHNANDKPQLLTQLNQYFDSLRIQYVLSGTDHKSADPKFKVNQSGMNWVLEQYATSPSPAIERYTQLTEQRFTTELHKHVIPKQRNISMRGIEFIRSLARNANLIIKPADKGLGITILDRAWYDKELLRQVTDTTTYRVALPKPPKLHQQLLKLVKPALKSHLMTERQHAYVTRKWNDDTSKLPNLYLLPKLHKTPVTGRPIVSSHSYITTPVSMWLDHILQPFVRKHIPTVLTDSRDLIHRIESTPITDPHCLLTTADVGSLYPSIPTNDGISAVASFLREICKMGNDKHISIICQLFEFVLTQNYFNANGNTYRQIKGTAMGTPSAVVFANIYMFMTYDQPLLLIIKPHVVLYSRFIDDVFVVTSGLPPTKLHGLMNRTNRKITLSIQSSPSSVDFLDLVIHKGTRFNEKQIFDLSVHQKEFNSYLYIPWNSFHTRAMKLAFIATELRRYVRNSSSKQSYERIRAAFYHRLRNRGYPRPFLIEAFEPIRYADRDRFLTTQPKQSKPFPLLFRTTYTPLTASLPIRSLLTKCWDVLDPSVFPAKPIIGYKRTTNISGMLCSAKT